VDLLNHFGAKNGFGMMQDSFEKDLDPVSMSAILRPLGNCAELLNPSAVCPMLTKCVEHAVNHVTMIEDKDLKNKVSIDFSLYSSVYKLYFLGYRSCP
jgi:hypothetical protein